MKKILTKNLIGSIIIAVFYMIPATVQAQVDSSQGRSAGQVIENSENNLNAMKRIRSLINEGDFERAESRSRRIIRTEDRNKRGGMGKTEFYKEVYNCLCVSLTGLGKVDDAMEACNTSIGHSPKHWESLKSRATLYYMTQNFPKSLEDFTSSLENAPDNEALTNVLKQNIGVVKSKIQ
ncbi:MAG: hypothetical protein HOJ34_08930 [Kordiimonadaceae bacterium]|jgi:tetratricopeptide (TPR) repeat protein|nr:hypothetical protein [Kordiimonadaceae bacterium]MBT6036127.1 hypothetical protein [Kordiimonadaceae bacterium]MBT6329892.1 hypothetical protein [Kordiimonadaceae bacterium]